MELKIDFLPVLCGLEKRCGEVIWNGKAYRPKEVEYLLYGNAGKSIISFLRNGVR
ncbi:MAG: hypothetical protein ACLRWH_09540 [Emergencia sp.]